MIHPVGYKVNHRYRGPVESYKIQDEADIIYHNLLLISKSLENSNLLLAELSDLLNHSKLHKVQDNIKYLIEEGL